ncbi:hypothetical protein [Marinobacter psychrophilus]|jgi:hypothetical protein|uniref:hypothetical protein n=1 Tax=Marinobacter psychrophilus TaxID=330734 RepID=UPI001B6DDB3E|nr:hypothetical protein [Marinobacter psychrophilus]MBQ0762079.1 hypothetical protein [Marinobacter psychrophilus]MBQ0843653.1 hypothetical protein [Marinobacter psychrophilus]
MSLGGSINDSDVEQHAILKEAATRMVLKGLSEGDAMSVAESLYADRREAERSGQVTTDEQGNTASYHDASLNLESLPESKRGLVNKIYHELCEKKGLEAL